MKSIISLFLFFMSTFCFSQNVVFGPEITLGQEVYDFGTVKLSNDTLVANFYFKNSGQDTLLIESVKPSCGCTVASFPKDAILPGTGGVIVLKYFRNTEGIINKSATIHSNATTNPYLVIRLMGEVVK